MPVTYSTIKSLTETDAMTTFLAEQVLQPVIPSAEVKKVRSKEGRRFEAPRYLWNVYEAEIGLPGEVEIHPLFWTKAFFNDADCQDYRRRVAHLLDKHGGNPLDPGGYARFFPDLNFFLFFFPTDPVFPRLPRLANADLVRPLLSEHFEHVRPGCQLRTLDSVRVKYLPEISCLFRFDGDVGEESPLSLYGKVQHSRRGELTYQVMKALWELPARRDGDLLLAEPLAYIPDEALLLQTALRGSEVKGDRHSDVFMQQAEAAGRMLGHVHASGISIGSAHSVAVEFNRIYNRLEEFKLSAPRVYMLIRDLLKQIAAKAERVRPEEPVPSHGDYKYNQFLWDGERFGMIDFEFFVQGEPSFDLGKYCGHVWPASPKHWSDTAQAKDARRIFLDAYCRVRPEYDGRRLAIYEALSLATRALVVTWNQSRNAAYMAETLTALGFEQLKARWGE